MSTPEDVTHITTYNSDTGEVRRRDIDEFVAECEVKQPQPDAYTCRDCGEFQFGNPCHHCGSTDVVQVMGEAAECPVCETVGVPRKVKGLDGYDCPKCEATWLHPASFASAGADAPTGPGAPSPSTDTQGRQA